MIIIQGCVKVKIPPDAIIAEEKFIRYLLVKRDYDDKSDYLKTAGFTLANYKNLIDEIRKLISKIEAIEERRKIEKNIITKYLINNLQII